MYTKKQIRSRRNRTKQVFIPGLDRAHGRKGNTEKSIVELIKGLFKK